MRRRRRWPRRIPTAAVVPRGRRIVVLCVRLCAAWHNHRGRRRLSAYRRLQRRRDQWHRPAARRVVAPRRHHEQRGDQNDNDRAAAQQKHASSLGRQALAHDGKREFVRKPCIARKQAPVVRGRARFSTSPLSASNPEARWRSARQSPRARGGQVGGGIGTLTRGCLCLEYAHPDVRDLRVGDRGRRHRLLGQQSGRRPAGLDTSCRSVHLTPVPCLAHGRPEDPSPLPHPQPRAHRNRSRDSSYSCLPLGRTVNHVY